MKQEWNKKVAFYTLGCKVNQYETNAMSQEFIKHGYEIVEFNESADIYIINTCTVTNMSDKKSRQMIRRTKELNPDAIVVATGCYAQVGKEKLKEIDQIDLILGVNEKNEMVTYVEDYMESHNKKKIVTDVMMQKEFKDFGMVTYTDKTRAVIKIQDGCDRFCSYCIIPYARGRVRSRKPESIIEEVKVICEKGIKEVVITGIHIASYGKDLKSDITLIDLLEELDKVEGIGRIRLGSLEPMILTDEAVKRLSKLDHLCKHFHLSLQSGCDETLKRMNRKYTKEEFREVVRRLREAFEDVILTTDIIVGFPGETDEEFEETYQFLKEINFYKMHVFPYSPREGTKAAAMSNQIDKKVKEQRSKRLIVLSDENEKEKNKSYIGSKLEVLFEEEQDGYMKGHTQSYIMVKVETKENLENKVKMIEVVGQEGLELIGK